MKHMLFALLLLGSVTTTFARTCEIFTEDLIAEKFMLDKGLTFAQSKDTADMAIVFTTKKSRTYTDHYGIVFGDYLYTKYKNTTAVGLGVFVKINGDWKLLTNEETSKTNSTKVRDEYYDEEYMKPALLKKAYAKIKKYKCNDVLTNKEPSLGISDSGRELATDKSSVSGKESKQSQASKQ